MTKTLQGLTLIGEEIEGDWNVQALADVAHGSGGRYLGIPPLEGATADRKDAIRLPTEASDPLAEFDWLMAAENTPDAVDIYRCRIPPGRMRPALLVGNEAKGLRRRTLKRADVTVQIPLISRNINCLNVAAAAAVMLAYLDLERPLVYPRRTLTAVQRERPDLLLIGGADHRELGSAIRSATAFGWDTLLLADRHAAWFDAERAIRAEGRGMARRGRNPIRVVPYAADLATAYRKIVILTREQTAEPLFTLPLTGRDTLLVLPDERDAAVDWRPPPSARARIITASLPAIPADLYHFRQAASIALAEAARQLGQPGSEGIYLPSRRDRYRREVAEESEKEHAECPPLPISSVRFR